MNGSLIWGRSARYPSGDADGQHTGLIHPSLETAPFDEFQLIVSQLDELGLGVEFSHGFEVS